MTRPRTIADIPTPALLVDVPAMKRNIRRMAEFIADGPCRLRPHFKAHKTPEAARREFDAAFQDHDVLVAPVSPTTAFRLGEKVDDPLQMYLSDVLTIPVNIAGLPGISVPCGFSPGDNGSRLPIGLQIIAKPFDEPTMFRAAYAYEQASDWHKQHPEL